MPPKMKMVLRVICNYLSRYLAFSVTFIGEEVNQRLETLLKTFLLDEHKNLDEVFAESGPLGTFYSRIEMAAALGLISSDERHDLNLIRKIRNQMAHYRPLQPGQSDEFWFEDEKVKSRCAQLKTPSQYDDKLFESLGGFDISTPEEATEALNLFLKACYSLIAILIVRTRNTARCQRPGSITDDEFRTAISEFHTDTIDPELEGVDELLNFLKPRERIQNLPKQQRKTALPE
jgi:hypothetical protein